MENIEEFLKINGFKKVEQSDDNKESKNYNEILTALIEYQKEMDKHGR